MFSFIMLMLISICIFVDIGVLAQLLGVFSVPYISGLFDGYPMLFFLFLLAQIALVILWVYAVYWKPVYDLNHEIVLFLNGMETNSSLKGTTFSKKMNYIIDFFVKSLQILKNFKEEIKTGRALR